MAMSNVKFFILCREAFFSRSGNDLNLIGIFDHFIRPQNFPVRILKFSAVLKIEVPQDDEEHELKMLIKCNGSVAAEEARTPVKKDDKYFQWINTYVDIKFEEEGSYTIECYLDDKITPIAEAELLP